MQGEFGKFRDAAGDPAQMCWKLPSRILVLVRRENHWKIRFPCLVLPGMFSIRADTPNLVFLVPVFRNFSGPTEKWPIQAAVKLPGFITFVILLQ